MRMGVARDGERRCCGPCLVRSSGPGGEVRASLGDPLVDDYLRCRGAVAPEHGSGDGLRPEGVLLGASLGHVVPDDLRTSVSWRGSIRRREWPALEKESTP